MNFFQKMEAAKKLAAIYEKIKDQDLDKDGKPDLLEAFEDLKSLKAAVEAHDGNKVLQLSEKIITLLGPDVELVAEAFGVAL